MSGRALSGASTSDCPSSSTSPAVGVSSVAMMRMVVLLPAPLGPMKPRMVPASNSNVTSSTARSAPKSRRSPFTCNRLIASPRLVASPSWFVHLPAHVMNPLVQLHLHCRQRPEAHPPHPRQEVPLLQGPQE